MSIGSKDDGGSAFPEIVTYLGRDRDTNESYSDVMSSGGMSIRDEFAKAAMAALIVKVPLHDRLGEIGISAPTVEQIHGVRVDIAQSAYDYADAMLAERAK